MVLDSYLLLWYDLAFLDFLVRRGRLHQSRCGLLLETLAFLRGRPNKGARTPNFRDYREQLNITFCSKKEEKIVVPFNATFCFNGSKTTFSTFFSSSFSWLSLWRPRKQANMPDRSSRSRRLRSLVGIRSAFTLQFVQLKIEFWAHKCNSQFGL